jgi:hypothetical protein
MDGGIERKGKKKKGRWSRRGGEEAEMKEKVADCRR